MSEDARKTREARRPARRVRHATIVALWLTAAGSAACDVPTALPRFENTLALPAPDIAVPVTGAATPALPVVVDLSNVDEDFAARARGGEIEFTPLNPQDGTGTLQITIHDSESATVVSQSVTVDAQGTPQIVSIGQDAMRAFLGGNVEITVTGTLGPAAIPTRYVTLETLVRITFEIGGD